MNANEKILTLIGEENRGAVPQEYLTDVRAVEAGGGGDCFFYSIHDALVNRKLKDRVDARFGTAGTKEQFVTLFRAVVANNAGEDLSILYQETCISKIGQYSDINEFRSFLQTSENPYWLNTLLIDTFRNYDSRRDGCLVNEPASPEVLKFIRQGKAGITRRTNFVGQLEVAITQRLLQEVGVYLDIKASKFSQLLNIENRITLYNIGAGHYQYFRPVASSRASSIDDTFTVVSERRPLRGTLPTPTIPSTVTVAPTLVVPKPVVPKPNVRKPVVTKPNVQKPVVPKPNVPKLVVPKPVVPTPNAQKPVVPKPNVQKPVVPKPNVQKPVVPTPNAQKPVVPTPNAQKPVVPTLVVPKTNGPNPNVPKLNMPKSNASKSVSRSHSMNRTQKITRQARRVQAAYRYVLDEVAMMEDFLKKSRAPE